jgi:hypothetical protein
MAMGLLVVDLVMRSASGGVTAWELAGPLAIAGFGMGMVFVPMFDVILAGVARAPSSGPPRACSSPCNSWRCR